MVWVYFFIGFFTAVFLATVWALVHRKRNSVGTIRIDTSDPDSPPYMFLELAVPFSVLYSKRMVICDVSTKNYISQK